MRQNVRNPAWTREELILALDLYLNSGPNPPTSASDPRNIELSQVLNSLVLPKGIRNRGSFRNANGVNMKLGNFRRFDPTYTGRGKVGLARGGELEKVIWDEYSNRQDELRAEAQNIKATALRCNELPIEIEIALDSFPEGRSVQILHITRERNAKLVDRAKERFKERHGSLVCEACGFDFEKVYGESGSGFIECHHNVPLSTLAKGAQTKLEDLTMLCSNCHRIIHRRRPWLSVADLRQLIMQNLD